jgi:hypothetical protein
MRSIKAAQRYWRQPKRLLRLLFILHHVIGGLLNGIQLTLGDGRRLGGLAWSRADQSHS